MQWDAFYGVMLTREQMEQRRLKAAEDMLSGMKQRDVARKYGVAESSVSRWAKTIRENGTNALKMRISSGKPHRLTKAQRQELIEILVAGPLEYGWKTDLWTAKRVKGVIEKEFGVSYHFKHVPKLLRALGFRPVKPKRRAREKDEVRKQDWIRTTWEQVKKT